MTTSKALLPLLFVPLLVASNGYAQAPQDSQPLQFEVVSIHPHHDTGNDPSNRRFLPGGRMVVSATSVRTLLRMAYNLDASQMTGGPHWLDTDTYDLEGVTVDHRDITTPEQFQQVLRSLLQDRFHLKAHMEQTTGPVFHLLWDRDGHPGPALKPSAAGTTPNQSNHANGATAVMSVRSCTMAEIAALLRRQAGRPVEDHTGATGRYDFDMEWATDRNPDPAAATLFTVLQEQLGLKLKPAQGLIPVLRIDQVERPSED